MRKPPVFWLLVALTILAALAGLWQWQTQRQEAAARIARQSQSSLSGPSQSKAPSFTLKTLDGTETSLAALRGKVVLLNFWATWCPPCKAEMPDLDALQRKYATDKDFVVLGVNFEEDPETVRSYMEEHKLTFPVALDRDGSVTTKSFGVRPLPTTFIIDREGLIRDAWNGQIAPEAMLARLERVW